MTYLRCFASMILLAVSAERGRAQGVVTTEDIVRATVSSTETFVGTVGPARRSVVGSAVDGRVEEVFVDAGDPVDWEPGTSPGERRGQPLVRLRTKTIEIELAAARAARTLRQKEWEELRNGARPEEVSQALSKMKAGEALLAYTTARLKRTAELFETSKSATREELDAAVSQRDAAEHALAGDRAAYELVRQGPRVEQIAQAEARLEMAKEEVNRLEDMVEKYTLRAPFRGWVVTKYAEVGNWISQGDPVMEVIELDPAEIVLPLPESRVSRLATGMPAALEVEAAPEGPRQGIVERIVPQADVRARTFPVKVRVDNPDGRLRAGMLARVTLPVGEPTDALLVSKDALILQGRAMSVAVVQQNEQGKWITQLVPVRIGVSQDDKVQVLDPSNTLRAGIKVVVRGNERLRPGQEVQLSGPVSPKSDSSR